MMNNLEPLGPLSGLGPEQGHQDAAARDSDDHKLASFMVQELVHPALSYWKFAR
jgi:hypothetical protein